MYKNIILASKSKVRKQILDKNNINSEVCASNVDEDAVKKWSKVIQDNYYDIFF